MKRFLIILIALLTMLVFVSCYSTTYVDEDKAYSFEAGEGNNSTLKLIDGTMYSEGSSKTGDTYFCYYTKSQRYYDMFEFGLINNSSKSNDAKIEFYYGDRASDSWKLAGKWNSGSYSQYNEDKVPIIFVKPNKNSVSLSNVRLENCVSGRIYVDNYSGDYKIVYTTESGEEIVSYFNYIK